jgi:hypothetical protein
MADRAQHLIYEQLYRPRLPNDPLPDPDISATTRRLWATAGRIVDALAAAGLLAQREPAPAGGEEPEQ